MEIISVASLLFLAACENGDNELVGQALITDGASAAPAEAVGDEMPEPDITPECTDSDGPASIHNKGYVYGIDLQGSEFEIYDECADDYTVVEYECIDLAEGPAASSRGLTCPAEEMCEDGACIAIPNDDSNETNQTNETTVNTCVDSDNGDSFATKGHITGEYNGAAFNNWDWCKEDGITLVETYCNHYNQYPVPATSAANCVDIGFDACEDGACVELDEEEPVPETITLHRNHLYCGTNAPMTTSPNGGLDQVMEVGEGTGYWNFKCYNRMDEQCSKVEQKVLVLDLNFDDGIGSSLRDMKSAKQAHVEYPQFVEGYKGKGMKFDGDGYIRIPNDNSFHMEKFDIEMYVKFDQLPKSWSGGPYWTMISKEWEYIYRFFNGYDENGYGRGVSAIYFSSRAIEHANAYLPDFKYTGTPYPGHESKEFDVATGQWYKMTMSYDGTYLTSKIDDKIIARTYSPYQPKKSSVDLMIGAHLTGGSVVSDGFIGVIDELKVYNTVREYDTTDSYYMEWCENANGDKVDKDGKVIGSAPADFSPPPAIDMISLREMKNEAYTSNAKGQAPESEELELPAEDPIEPIEPQPDPEDNELADESISAPAIQGQEPFPLEPEPVPQHIPQDALSMDSSDKIEPAVPAHRNTLSAESVEIPLSGQLNDPVPAPTHSICWRYTCREVKGLGTDECTENSDCTQGLTPETALELMKEGAQEPEPQPIPVEPEDECKFKLFGWCIIKGAAK